MCLNILAINMTACTVVGGVGEGMYVPAIRPRILLLTAGRRRNTVQIVKDTLGWNILLCPSRFLPKFQGAGGSSLNLPRRQSPTSSRQVTMYIAPLRAILNSISTTPEMVYRSGHPQLINKILLSRLKV